MSETDAQMAERELADFEPSTGHLHGCPRGDCACAPHLYAIAQDAERALHAVLQGEA